MSIERVIAKVVSHKEFFKINSIKYSAIFMQSIYKFTVISK